MSSSPVPAPAHPAWCSPEHCEVGREVRGFGDHRSAPHVIEPSMPVSAESITAWLAQYGYAPPAESPVYLVLRFTEPSSHGEELDRVDTHALPVDQVTSVLDALTALERAGTTS